MSEHGRGRRDALIAAAYRRIATEGFEGRRTRDVAADVGGNIATLHYYFPTKQELIRSVVGQAMQPFQATLPADGSPVDQLREHLGALARLLKEDQELWSVMGELVLRAPRDANLAQIFRQTDAYWHRALRDLIARAADQGTIAPSVDPDDTAALMIAAIKGLSLPTVTGFQPAVADQVFRQLSDCSARPCSIHNQEDATMSAISPVSPARSHAPPSGAMHLFTRLVLRLAGGRLTPLYGVIEHRGRRSGEMFRTPVVARPTLDGFIVPMPWGEGTDWYRSVRAAGGCTIRWKGRDYPVGEPVVLSGDEARAEFGRFQAAMMGRLGIEQAVRLRHRR